MAARRTSGRKPTAAQPRTSVVVSPWAMTGRRLGWTAVLAVGGWIMLSAVLADKVLAAWIVFFVVACAGATVYSLWRKRWIDKLSAAGIPAPNIFRLHADIAKAQKRRMQVLTRWNRVVENHAKLQGKVNGSTIAANLDRLDLTADGNVKAEVDMGRIARSINDLRGVADAIEGVTRSTLVIREKSKGVASLTFQYTDPLHTVLPFHHLHVPTTKGTICPGLTEDGQPYEVPINKPILIGGEQRSGKSVALWALIGAALARGWWLKLYVVDPKGGMELGRLDQAGDKVPGEWHNRLQVAAFAANYTEGLRVIKAARNEQDMRTKAFRKDKSRVLEEPTQENPLIVLVVDEGLNFTKELQDPKSDLQVYTREGPASLCTTWLLVQYAHANALGEGRKLFGVRLAFRCEEETGRTILGKAYDKGAKTDEIPRRTPGIGYAQDDEGRLVRIRVAWVPDEVADIIADGRVPEGMGDQRRFIEPEHAVYVLFGWRHLGGPGTASCRARKCTCPRDVCLYVGETNSWDRRQREHAEEKARFGEIDWWVDVDWNHPLTRVDWKINYKVAKAEESRYIRKYGPVYNVQENGWNLLRKEWKAGRGRAGAGPTPHLDQQPIVIDEPAREPVAVGAPPAAYGQPFIEGEVVSDSGWTQPPPPASYTRPRSR